MIKLSPITNKGFFLCERGWSEIQFLQDKGKVTYPKKAAWMDLLELASYGERLFECDGLTVPLKRGQYVVSLRFLGNRWGWGKDKVKGFLKRLELIGWITISLEYAVLIDTDQTGLSTERNNPPHLIIINEYNELQHSDGSDHHNDADTDQTAQEEDVRHFRDKPETNKNHKNKNQKNKPDRLHSRSHENKTLREKYPMVDGAENFCNHFGQEAENYARDKYGWSMDKIEEQLIEFWNYYTEKKPDIQKANWVSVWKKWCEQPFRN